MKTFPIYKHYWVIKPFSRIWLIYSWNSQKRKSFSWRSYFFLVSVLASFLFLIVSDNITPFGLLKKSAIYNAYNAYKASKIFKNSPYIAAINLMLSDIASSQHRFAILIFTLVALGGRVSLIKKPSFTSRRAWETWKNYRFSCIIIIRPKKKILSKTLSRIYWAELPL